MEYKRYNIEELQEYKNDILQDITELESELSDVVEELENRELSENRTYHIGQIFTIGFDEHILAQTGFGKVNLIDLYDGNRLSNAVKVDCVNMITKTELNKLTKYWELIE